MYFLTYMYSATHDASRRVGRRDLDTPVAVEAKIKSREFGDGGSDRGCCCAVRKLHDRFRVKDNNNFTVWIIIIASYEQDLAETPSGI